MRTIRSSWASGWICASFMSSSGAVVICASWPPIERNVCISAAILSRIAPQSVMTSPLYSHSLRRTSVSNHLFSEQNVPLIRLYAHITAAGFACLTMYSNWRRYRRRAVFSLATELPMKRYFSLLLSAKCFTHAPTPFDCTPSTIAAPSTPER